MDAQKIYKVAELFEKLAIDYDDPPPTQPEGLAEEDAPDTEKPEDITYPELEGPTTERAGPPAELARPTEGVPVNITMDSSLLVSGLRFLQHRIKIEEASINREFKTPEEIPTHKKNHLNKLNSFYNQLENALKS